MDRYLKNKNMISQEEQEKLGKSKVIVLGCGGLGGHNIDMLARVGVGNLTLVDFDRFDESNLNRQLVSTENNLGKYKVEEAKKRVNQVNSNVEVTAINKKISKENIDNLIKGMDVVVDALDNSVLKKEVELACERNHIPMVHGAIGGFVGQVAVIMPGDRILDKIYGDENLSNPKGNPSFTPATIASMQVGEVVKILLNRREVLSREILYIDLEVHSYRKIRI